MTKKLLLLCGLILSSELRAENLIKNPEFDKPPATECFLDSNPGCAKMEQFTEDLTWNKCLRLEALKYHQNKDAKDDYYASVLIGGNPKIAGFAVSPNTIYKFSLELKGNFSAKNVGIQATEWTSDDFWKGRRSLKIKGDLEFKPSDKWAVYSGEFQTGPDAKSAAVNILIYGTSRYNNLPSINGFLLVDKVKVEKVVDLLDKSENSTVTRPENECRVLGTLPGNKGSGFVEYRTGVPVKADTVVQAAMGSESLQLDIRCYEPDMAKLQQNVKNDGANPWLDDVVEIFFDPLSAERAFTQLVVAAGGGRWMGFGGSRPENRYDQWKAQVVLGDSYWDVRLQVPYSLLGWSGRPADGTMIGFNVARQRKAENELSSWSFAAGSFNDRKKFGCLLLGAPEIWRSNTAAELEKALSPLPNEQGKTTLQIELEAWKKQKSPSLGKTLSEAENFRHRINQLKLRKLLFVLTEVAPTLEPDIPILPDTILNPPERLQIRAAGNEFKPLPLAVTNLTNAAEEYRVVICNLDKVGAELPGLCSADGKIFPAEKIQLLRGIRVKDGEGEKHGKRFDPLTPMDISGTVVVQPKESGLVWAIFNTSQVAPGNYSGTIRVIPLSEPLKNVDDAKSIYQGAILELPLKLEVLPFELDQNPAIPFFMFQRPLNEDFFKMMVDYGIHDFLVSPWSFKAVFNSDGSIRSTDTSKAEEQIDNLLKWGKKYGIDQDMKISITYGAYTLFRDEWSRKQFKTNTVEWQRAWQNYVKLLDNTMKKHGVTHDRYYVEIWDEPSTKDQDELLAACRTAYEAVPEMDRMVVFASWAFPTSYLEKLRPYVKTWNFWKDRYIGNPKYLDFITLLRKDKKKISFYSCETTMRLNLHRYYRLHAWFGLAHQLDMISIFQLIDSSGDYGLSNWKTTTRGGVIYMAGKQPVSSIRMECLRIGATDIKYIKKLADTLKDHPNADPNARAETEKFLSEVSTLVASKMAHDSRQPELAREKTIDLILKLQR